VVSGVTMSFQFGTNWPGYMKTVGNIAGPCFPTRSCSPFSRGRIHRRDALRRAARLAAHACGGRLPGRARHHDFGVLDLALDSWMQTPAGFTMIDGQAHVASWLAVIFNPSFPYRFTHMLLASG